MNTTKNYTNEKFNLPATQEATGSFIIVPLALGKTDEDRLYQLPVEVMVKVQAKQRVIKRYTHHSSNKGSIKEQWGMGDYGIDIRGTLYADSNAGGVTANKKLQQEIKELKKYFYAGLVKVDCPLLALFDIHYMMIENLNFPFTQPGLEIVPFEIRGISDFRQDELLTEIL